MKPKDAKQKKFDNYCKTHQTRKKKRQTYKKKSKNRFEHFEEVKKC